MSVSTMSLIGLVREAAKKAIALATSPGTHLGAVGGRFSERVTVSGEQRVLPSFLDPSAEPAGRGNLSVLTRQAEFFLANGSDSELYEVAHGIGVRLDEYRIVS